MTGRFPRATRLAVTSIGVCLLAGACGGSAPSSQGDTVEIFVPLATVEPLPPLDDIRVPVLVLLSGGTTLASVAANRQAAERFPACEVVTLEANHWPLTETPEAVRSAIEAWTSRAMSDA